MNSPTNSILLTSGGLDSTTLAYWMINNGIDFTPVFIDYGQHCAETEYRTLCQVLPPEKAEIVNKIDVSDIYRNTNSRLVKEANLWTEEVTADDLYLPYRNLLILSIASAFAQSRGYSYVYAAFINSNHAKEIDCSSKFFAKLSIILSEYGSVQIVTPFRDWSKKDVALMGIKLNVPIGKTYSCQATSHFPCGACPNCVERLNALSGC